MSVLQPISFGLVHQVGPGSGAKGYGSYQADNTATMRPYQQQSASPIGRGYPITVISGGPTFFTPDVKEDPIVTLLKMLVDQGKKVVAEKEPDAGFRNNLPVFPPEGPAGDPQPAGGRALGAVPVGDRPNAGPGSDSFYTVSEGSTDYGSLNEFKPELAQLVNIDRWADNVKNELTASILGKEDVGVQTGPAFGRGAGSQTKITGEAVEELGKLMEANISSYEMERGLLRTETGRFRTATQYIAGMIDYLNLTPLSFEDILILNEGEDVDEVKRIVDGVVETYQFELNKRITEGTAKEVAYAGTQTRPIRNRRGLRINTGVEKSMRNAGEQFNRIERPRVEGGRPMDAYIPNPEKRKRVKEGPWPQYAPGNLRKRRR